MRNLCFFLLALAALLSGCNKSEPVAAKPAAAAAPAPPVRPFPKIVSASPSSLDATNGTVWISDVHVSYIIPSPERVTKAEVQLYNAASRVIARTDIPIQAKGDFDWNVGTNASIGPAVRLRASCPNGETDWVVLGLHIYPASTAGTYINNVTPQYIRETYSWQNPEAGPPGVTSIGVWGAGFQPDCKVLATVNNTPLDGLQTAYAGPSHLMVQLPWVGEVGSRYIEVKLIVRGQGFATEDIFSINVTDQ